MHDLFISHASEDKEELVRPLALALVDHGLSIWYDEFTLKLGDSLSESIDRGLAGSRYGLVVLSKDFFSKKWPQRELRGLVSREISTGKAILPIWHNVSFSDVVKFSPPLAACRTFGLLPTGYAIIMPFEATEGRHVPLHRHRP